MRHSLFKNVQQIILIILLLKSYFIPIEFIINKILVLKALALPLGQRLWQWLWFLGLHLAQHFIWLHFMWFHCLFVFRMTQNNYL